MQFHHLAADIGTHLYFHLGLYLAVGGHHFHDGPAFGLFDRYFQFVAFADDTGGFEDGQQDDQRYDADATVPDGFFIHKTGRMLRAK